MTVTPPTWYAPSHTTEQPPRERLSDRAFLAVAAVVLLVAAAVGTAGLAYVLDHRPAAAASRDDAMTRALYEMGIPQGFKLLDTAPYHGVLTAHYQVLCGGTDGACPVDVPRVVAAWAHSAGYPDVTEADLKITPLEGWTVTFARGAMSVHLLLTTDSFGLVPWYTLQVDVSPL